MSPWIQLSEAQAEAHPSFGRGGFVGLFLILLGLLQIVLAIQIDWPGLSDPVFYGLVALFGLVASTFALGITYGILFPRLGSILALLAAGLFATAAVIILIAGPTEVAQAFVSLGASLNLPIPPVTAEDPRSLAIGLGGAALVFFFFAAYLRLSRQVNVTYLARVRRGDPFLLKIGS